MIQGSAGTHPRTPVEQFAGVAALELSSLKALVGVLNEEREALTQGDAEALPGLIASKTRHMTELARYSSERGRLLTASGVAPRGSEIRAFLGASETALETWEALLSAAHKAAGLNTANAFLTSTRLASVSRALATLTGAQPDFYDTRGGNSRPSGTSRPLSRG